MISVTRFTGTKVSFTRKIEFPKVPPLAAYKNALPYEVDITMGGIDPKSPEGKKIMKAFPKAYEAALNKAVKPRRQENADAWKAAASKIRDGVAPATVEKEIMAHLQGRWDDFATRNAAAVAQTTMVSLIGQVAKDHKGATPRGTLGHKGVWGDLAGVSKALFDAAKEAAKTTVEVVVSSAAKVTLGAVSASVTALIKARKVSEKHYTDLEIVSKGISKDLADVAKTLKSLESRLSDLDKSKAALDKDITFKAAQVSVVKGNLPKFRAEMKSDAEATAMVKKSESELSKLQAALSTLKARREKFDFDTKPARALIGQAEKVSGAFQVDLSGYDKFLKAAENFQSFEVSFESVMEKVHDRWGKKS